MKIIRASAKSFFSLVVLILVFGTPAAFGQSEPQFSIDTSPLPAPTSPVTDLAGVIDQATKTALEKRIIDFKTATGVELAVAVVRTTGERPIFDFSLAVARGWGIGSKEDDNPGALLFVAVDDRKYFTHVSRNLEDELPDGVVGGLQRQFLVPEFKKANYAKGISDTIEAYIKTIEAKRSGTATPTPPPAAGTGRGRGGSLGYSGFCCLAVILFIILIIWSNRGGGGGRRSRSDYDRWGGGGFGAALPWIIGSAIANAASSSSSSSSGWGSSSSSGGSDWGGFGGGGDFGGGGAGGDW
jgi:uncharacterized protein